MEDISSPPNGTTCNDAVELPHNMTLQGTTVGASIAERPPCDQDIEGTSSSGNPGVFYYVAPMEAPSSISISMTGASESFDLRVYEGSSCEELKCKEVETTKDGKTTYADWMAAMNETFYVYVSAADAGDGSVTTDRFGIVMVHDVLNATEPPSSAAPLWKALCASFFFTGAIALLHFQ
jgi:hypothetical protein